MKILSRTSASLWGALLLITVPGTNVNGQLQFFTNAPAVSATRTNQTNVVRPQALMNAYKAQVVMVDVWDEKFAVEYEGKVHQFKLAHGGILLRNGKPTSLNAFTVGQEIMLLVSERASGSADLLSASV